MKCGNCGYAGNPERNGEHFVADHFDHAHNEIKQLKKDLPFLMTCLNVIKSSGVKGLEIKRAIEIVKEKMDIYE